MATYQGTSGSNVLTGTSADDTFVGSGGNDTITGNGGSDFINYLGFSGFPGITGPISVSFAGSSGYTGTVTKFGSSAGTDTFTGIRGIVGTSGADVFVGTDVLTGPFSVVFRGGAGNDSIDGRKNSYNMASYITASAGVVVNLETSNDGAGSWSGVAQDGQGGTDTLTNVVRVQGSNFNDTITGSSAADQFQGSLGNDAYDGRADLQSDLLRYDGLGGFAVSVVAGDPLGGLFGEGTATITKVSLSGGADLFDESTNVNRFVGTASDDTFVGTDATYSFFSYRFVGGQGSDTIDGRGNGSNRVDYGNSIGAVSVDLAAGVAQDGFGTTDTLIDVRGVHGSAYNDLLLGGVGDDTFVLGDSGLHTVNGRQGRNTVSFNGNESVTIDLGTVPTSDGFGGYQGTITKSTGTVTISNISNVYGGYGDDFVGGSLSDNFLSGGPGNNTVDGRGGFDFLDYRVFAGLGTQTSGAIVDLGDGVSGSATNPWGGSDVLVSIESVRGSQFNDSLTGAALADGIFSYVRGEGGSDTIVGRVSSGIQIVADYFDSLSGVSVNLTLQKTTDDGWYGGQDTLLNIASARGSAFSDRLIGDSMTNWLSGGSGNDVLNGRGGTDTLIGGAGDDTYYVDNAGDQVFEAVGGGVDRVLTSVSFAQTTPQEIERIETTSEAGTNAIDLTGNKYANTLVGNAGANVLNGRVGADMLYGLGGNDTYYVDNAGDQVFEAVGGGTDRVLTSVSFAFTGLQEIERVETTNETGTDAIDLTGNKYANTLVGNAGANVLNGKLGADVLYGLGGNDTYYVDNAGDQVFEAVGGGTDRVLTSVSFAQTTAQEIERIETTNEAGTDAIDLTGNKYANTLVGNAGANVLDGRAAADVLTGNAGSDIFVFSTALGSSNVDHLTDFVVADDTIQLARSIFSALAPGQMTDTAFVDLAMRSADETDRIFYNSADGSLSYDADGSGNASAAVQFAILDTRPTLTHTDFFVA